METSTPAVAMEAFQGAFMAAAGSLSCPLCPHMKNPHSLFLIVHFCFVLFS